MSKAAVLAVAAAALLAVGVPARAQQADFPDGPGKETFLATCGGCHDINRARAGYTAEGWRTVMQMMLNFGGAGPKDQVATLTEYLIKSFPERPRPAAKIVEGPVQASIKLWDVPTPGSRPHDPLADQGRRHLVDRPDGQQARPGRSEDRHDQGIPAQDAAHRAARPGRGQGRQHLVHRQPRRA